MPKTLFERMSGAQRDPMPSHNQPDLTVTDADREAFAAVCHGWWRNMKPEKIAEFARAGEIDNDELVQAFARHREQSIAPYREALEKIASCESHHPDDIVAIARTTLQSTGGG